MLNTPRPQLSELCTDVQSLLDVFNEHDDSSCMIVAGNYLEQSLRELLCARPREEASDETKSSAIGARSFAQKIELGSARGLLPEELRRDLDRVRDIRNHAAHSHKLLSFEDPTIRASCMALTLPDVQLDFAIGFPPGEEPKPWRGCDTPRTRFTTAVALLVNRLLLMALSIQHSPTAETGARARPPGSESNRGCP